MTWGQQRLILHTSSGQMASCPNSAPGGACQPMDLPPVHEALAVVTEPMKPHPFRLAIHNGQSILLHELKSTGLNQHWAPTMELAVPKTHAKAVSLTGASSSNLFLEMVSGDHEHLLLGLDDGSVIHWPLDSLEPSREVPSAGPRRNWSCACRSQGKVLRLAGKWHKMGQQMTWKPQLLMCLH